MDKKESRKTEEDYEKDYSSKIGVLTKSFETDKPDKVLLDLIEIIPRESKSEQLKEKYVTLFHSILNKLKEDGIKNVVNGLEEKNMPKFYSYLNKAILLMVHSNSEFNPGLLNKTMSILSDKKGYSAISMYAFRRDLRF